MPYNPIRFFALQLKLLLRIFHASEISKWQCTENGNENVELDICDECKHL